MDTDYIKIHSTISICSQYGYGFYQNTFKDFYLFEENLNLTLNWRDLRFLEKKENPERIKVITDKAWYKIAIKRPLTDTR